MIAAPARRGFVVHARCAAPPAIVFSLLADASTWPRWAAVPRARVERAGTPAPHGVGAIRRFSGGPITSREQVVAYEPPRHFAYILLSGLPVRDYRADVELMPVASGTAIVWRASFRAAIPCTGPLLVWFFRWTIARMARGLARRAVELTGAAPDSSP